MVESQKQNPEPALWAKFAVLDGAARAGSTVFQKLAGTSLASIDGILISNWIIELIRFVFGIIGVRVQGIGVGLSRRQRRLLLSIAAVATIMTILHLYSYEIGADQGVATFILLLSIIPGAAIDRIFFKTPILRTQILGIIVFLVAGWCFLDFPGTQELLGLPWWVRTKAIVALLLAINEGQRRILASTMEGEKTIAPTQMAFWVGFLSLLMLSVTLVVTGWWHSVVDLSHQAVVASLGMGTMVVLSTIGGILSYTLGGNITVKKFLANSTSLILAIIFGVVVHSESLTIGKIIGVPFVLLAFILFDRDGVLRNTFCLSRKPRF